MIFDSLTTANANIWERNCDVCWLQTADYKPKLIVTDTRRLPKRQTNVLQQLKNTRISGSPEILCGKQPLADTVKLFAVHYSLLDFISLRGLVPGRARSKTVMDSRLKSGRDTLPFCRTIKPVLFQKLHAKWPDNEPLLLSQLHRGFRDSNQEDETATFKLGNFAWLHSKQQSSNRGAFLLFAYSSSKLKNKLIMRSCHWRQLQPHQKENSGGKSVHWDTVRDLENSCWAFFLSRSIYLNIYTDIHTYIYVHSIFDSSFDSPIRLGVHDHVHLDLLPLFFFFALLLPTPLVLKFNCIFFNNSSTKWKFMQTLADKNGIPKPSVPPQKDERDEA